MFYRARRQLLTSLASLAALSLVMVGCGDGGASSAGGAATHGGGSAGSGKGPDASNVQKELLDQVNLQVEGLARFVSFKEVGREFEQMDEIQGCMVSFEGEMEFDGACYYHMAERKKGDRLFFEATAEFVKDGPEWRQLVKGIYPH